MAVEPGKVNTDALRQGDRGRASEVTHGVCLSRRISPALGTAQGGRSGKECLMRAIRAAWLAAFVGAIVGWGMPPSQSMFILVPATVLGLTAWGAAIYRSARRGEMGWVFLIAVIPSISMWF